MKKAIKRAQKRLKKFPTFGIRKDRMNDPLVKKMLKAINDKSNIKKSIEAQNMLMMIKKNHIIIVDSHEMRKYKFQYNNETNRYLNDINEEVILIKGDTIETLLPSYKNMYWVRSKKKDIKSFSPTKDKNDKMPRDIVLKICKLAFKKKFSRIKKFYDMKDPATKKWCEKSFDKLWRDVSWRNDVDKIVVDESEPLVGYDDEYFKVGFESYIGHKGILDNLILVKRDDVWKVVYRRR